MDGISFTKLKIIDNENGDILHALKSSEDDFLCFGEAYFSFVNDRKVKGWKKHNRMTLNVIVPIGKIKFVVFDEQRLKFQEYELSQSNYGRLSILPGYWVGFMGLSPVNMLLNIASIEHDPTESVSLSLKEIPYDW
jgi:dTDP-4-dehydrorhamnose 3,5-epimerase